MLPMWSALFEFWPCGTSVNLMLFREVMQRKNKRNFAILFLYICGGSFDFGRDSSLSRPEKKMHTTQVLEQATAHGAAQPQARRDPYHLHQPQLPLHAPEAQHRFTCLRSLSLRPLAGRLILTLLGLRWTNWMGQVDPLHFGTLKEDMQV